MRRSTFTCTSFIPLAMPYCCTSIAAGQAPPDKSGYHLFNPTPDEQLRPLSADRPDVTESPYTVDPGRFQVEMSFVEYVTDDDGPGRRVHAFSAAPFNVKAGLLPDLEVQFVFEPYVREHVEGGGTSDGIGDVQIRAKLNLWGNDGGDTAFALLPFITIPTASEDLGADEVEGGVALPFATSVGDWDLGLMAEVGLVSDRDDGRHDVELLHTAALGRTIAGDLGGYVEYIGVASTEGGYLASLGTGLTFALDRDTQLDAGAIIGLSSGADDLSLFTGVTLRF